MTEVVNCRSFNTEDWVQTTQICDGHSGNGIGFPLSSEFSRQYHCTSPPYSLFHLPLTLYNLTNWHHYMTHIEKTVLSLLITWSYAIII
jgi:hypothetical protein